MSRVQKRVTAFKQNLGLPREIAMTTPNVAYGIFFEEKNDDDFTLKIALRVLTVIFFVPLLIIAALAALVAATLLVAQTLAFTFQYIFAAALDFISPQKNSLPTSQKGTDALLRDEMNTPGEQPPVHSKPLFTPNSDAVVEPIFNLFNSPTAP